jgi:lysophospholipase L1-like esterase
LLPQLLLGSQRTMTHSGTRPQWCCLAAGILFLLGFVVPTPNFGVSAQVAPTKIMPLGDSITDGYTIPGGYRVDLWSTVQHTGQPIDFVGSLSNGPVSLGDKQHEGHAGWRIDQIDANVTGWLNSAQPEVVLLMIGTNDMLQEFDATNAPARLSALIDKITEHSPALQVIVASLPPLSSPIANQRVLNFNAAIPNIVSAKTANGKKVAFVDMYPALTLSDLDDGIHPNASGYTKLANAWYGALSPFLSPASSTPTPSLAPTLTHTPSPSATPVPGSASFYRAINLAGPAVVYEGHPWDASTATTYSIAGASQCCEHIDAKRASRPSDGHHRSAKFSVTRDEQQARSNGKHQSGHPPSHFEA